MNSLTEIEENEDIKFFFNKWMKNKTNSRLTNQLQNLIDASHCYNSVKGS